jgi:L-ribulokinase
VAAGAYPDIRAAAASMGRVVRDAWQPSEDAAARYDALYAEYVGLVDYFGRHGNDVMRRLRKIRREALS